MTTFFLIRHAPHRLVDAVLVGRTAGAQLDEEGLTKAVHIANYLASKRIAAIQSSPQTRALETAMPIADRTGASIEIAADVDEIDTGEWSGQPFAMLRDDPLWQRWNARRSSARPPRGESMQELQQRIVRHLHRTSIDRPNERIAVVSHAEVIRAAILHFLEITIDDFWRVEIAPASITTLVINQQSARCLAVNEAVPA